MKKTVMLLLVVLVILIGVVLSYFTRSDKRSVLEEEVNRDIKTPSSQNSVINDKPSSENSGILGEKYADAQLGIEISVPKGWVSIPGTRAQIPVTFQDSDQKNWITTASFQFKPGITVYHLLFESGSNLQMAEAAVYDFWRDARSGYKILKKQKVRLGTNDAYILDVSFKLSEGGPVYEFISRDLIVSDGNRKSYHLTAQFTPSLWGEYKDIVEQSYMTFKFTN